MEKDEKILLSSILDKAEKSYNKNIPAYTNFLDMHQQTLVSQQAKAFKGSYVLFGGYPDAERKLVAFLPDYLQEPECDVIKAVHVTVNGREQLTHRDYLGASLGLGIKRDQLGDILINEKGADILVKGEMADFLCNNLVKAGRANLSCTVKELNEIEFAPPEPKESRLVSASSLRLDKIVAEGFKISRTEAASLILSGGKVFVNQKEVLKPDFQLAECDKITLRGKGKIELSSLNGISKKGKLRVELKIY
ncbi:MAG: hypothetical protein IJN39_04035 [Clostridia bacterium]|nr:hypothetical protein [Clostridia bacterium]